MARLQTWLRAAFSLTVKRRIRSRRFMPVLECLEDRRLLSATVTLGNVVSINSFAGVGFKENVACDYLAASLNGQPDLSKSDLQAQINWGDGSTSVGDLVLTGHDSVYGFYLIKGSHVYSQTGTNIPIHVTVNGPEDATTSALTAYAGVAPMPSGIAGTPPPASQAGTAEDVRVTLGNVVSVNSFTGVGFQENVAADYLAVSVNGKPDPHLGDIHAEINWGDSDSWSAGDLVYLSSDAQYAFYEIKGSHIYAQAATNVPIVVYVSGPDGTSTSALTAYAGVTDMPSGIPGTPPPASTGSLAPSNVRESLGDIVSVSAKAGVNLQNVEVADYLAVSVNGQPDGNAGDLQAEINWGDSASWTTGTLVYVGSDSQSAFYQITGSHEYQKTATQVSIVVYVNGPDGTSTSALTAYASVAPNPNAISLGNLSLTQWTQDQSGYDGTISVNGGQGGYTTPQITGLPDGLSGHLESTSGTVNGKTVQSGTITISGTPTEAGTFNVQVTVSDGNGDSATKLYTLTIQTAPVTLGGLSPTEWTVNQSGYDGTIAVSGGTGTYGNLQVTGLPAGLDAQLSGNTIGITGTPTQAGTFDNISVSLRDDNGDTGSGTYSLTIDTVADTPITLGTLTPTQWPVNQPGYDGTISIKGGAGSYIDLQVTGLPAGLEANVESSTVTVNGKPQLVGTIFIEGTPTESGIFTVGVSLEDSGQQAVAAAMAPRALAAAAQESANKTFQLTVTAGRSLGSLTPSEWTVNQAYRGTIQVPGLNGVAGQATVSPLPPGLQTSQSGNYIILSGIPTQVGNFNNIQVSVPAGTGVTDYGTVSLKINPAITLGPLNQTTGTQNQIYTGTISVTGGTGAYSNAQVTGASWLGAAVSGKTIILTGIPPQSGPVSITVSVQDITGAQGSRDYQLTINVSVALGSLTPAQGIINQAYTGKISVSGGSGKYRPPTVTGLPNGLHPTLQGSTIVISGTPTQSGQFNNVKVTVQDSNGASASQTYQLTIDSAVTLGVLNPVQGTVNQLYTGTVAVSGGTGSYNTPTITGLPATLHGALAGNTITISGTPTQSGLITFTVQVQDSMGASARKQYQLTIVQPDIAVSSFHWVPVQLGVDTASNVAFNLQSQGYTGQVQLTLYQSANGVTRGAVLATATVNVNANTQTTQQMSITQAPTGTVTSLIVDAEPTTSIQEKSRANNAATLRIAEPGPLSVELQDQAPIANTRMDRVALWLAQNEKTITIAARSYNVPAEAIAGAIAWEALDNVATLKTYQGPGKVHPIGSQLGVPSAAEQVETLGLMPAVNPLQRAELVQTTQGAVQYIAAILDSYAEGAEAAGSTADIRDNAAVLDTFYNGVVKAVPSSLVQPYFATYPFSGKTYILPLNAESWFRYSINVLHVDTYSPGPTMGAWVNTNLAWLRMAVGGN